MTKKLITKPPEPNLKHCKTCLVQAMCSIDNLIECPDVWAEIMKIGSFVYWPAVLENCTKNSLIEEGYSEEDAELMNKLPKILQDIRKHKLTIRPATKRDRNVAKFVITEY